jgi:hypothetical protein
MRGDVAEGLLHLLARDLTALCGCPFGLVAGSPERATCDSCLAQAEALGLLLPEARTEQGH